MKQITCSFFLMLVTIAGGGCSAPQVSPVIKAPLIEQGEVYLYLQPLPQEMESIGFTMNEIAVLPEQGAPISIIDTRRVIKGKELVGIQKRLTVGRLPPGRYRGILLTIGQADIATEAGPQDLMPPQGPVKVELNFSILRGKSQALFLVLSPEFLVTDNIKFTPTFSMGRPYLPPRNYMGLISNTYENIVTVFNKRTVEVIQVIHTGSSPKGMALDQQSGIAYVAVSGEDTIALISLTTMEIIGRVRLRFGDQPTEVALTPDGSTLLSVNYGNGTVSIIDTRSMAERDRLVLSPDPAWVTVSGDSRMAYVLHSLSNTVSVIDLPGRKLITSLTLEESPLRGELGNNGESLYIVSQYSSDLLVIDTRSYRVTGRIFVGNRSTSLKVDPKTNLIYVGKASGEVAVVDPASGIFIDSFWVDRDLGFITIDGEENALFVLADAGNKMQKFNIVSKRKRAELVTEEGGHALVVMGEM